MEEVKKSYRLLPNNELIKKYNDITAQLIELLDFIVFHNSDESDNDIQHCVDSYNKKLDEKKVIENELSYRNIVV